MNRHKKILFVFITSIFSLFIFIFSGEIVCRYLLNEYLVFDIPLDERNLHYRFDRQLGWFPSGNSAGTFSGNQTINIRHNGSGFRDKEHGEKTKPRILFLGDSFVWGYDVEMEERFTEKLQKKLPQWEMVNLGVSGYGTDQEYLLLEREFDHYEPDLVFLMISFTDLEIDNISNKVYQGYYKPYFTLEKGEPVLKGLPVPKSINYYYAKHQKLFSYSYLLRGLLKVCFSRVNPDKITVPDPTVEILNKINLFLQSKGVQFIVGFETEYPSISDFCRLNNIPYVNVVNNLRYATHGFHWTPEGHSYVADKIYDFLKNR